MIERSADEVSVDFGGSAIEILICMKPVVGKNAGGVSFDQIRSRGDQLLK